MLQSPFSNIQVICDKIEKKDYPDILLGCENMM